MIKNEQKPAIFENFDMSISCESVRHKTDDPVQYLFVSHKCKTCFLCHTCWMILFDLIYESFIDCNIMICRYCHEQIPDINQAYEIRRI